MFLRSRFRVFQKNCFKNLEKSVKVKKNACRRVTFSRKRKLEKVGGKVTAAVAGYRVLKEFSAEFSPDFVIFGDDNEKTTRTTLESHQELIK